MRSTHTTVPSHLAAPLAVTAALLAMLAGCASSEPARPRSTTAGTTATEPTALSRPGPAEYGVVSRELAAIENAPIDNVYQATQDALRGLELKVVDKTKDRLNATLGARTAHDDRVSVSLSRVSSGVTDVKIKVGFWGDETQSRAILTEIRKNLSAGVKSVDSPNSVPTVQPGVLAAAPKTPAAKSPASAPATGTAPIAKASKPVTPAASKPAPTSTSPSSPR